MNAPTKEPWPAPVQDNEYGPGSATYWEIQGVGQFYGSEQDARRIVACVNACTGLDQEKIEGTAPGLIKRMVADEMRRATAQRAELLAALDQILNGTYLDQQKNHNDDGLRDFDAEWRPSPEVIERLRNVASAALEKVAM